MSEPMTEDDIDRIEGTADPAELRHMAEAWPKDIFPTPPESKQAKDAAVAHVLRRLAVPHFLACADEIERLRAGIREVARDPARRRRMSVNECLCAPPHPSHGGPCCGVAGGQCVTCAARERETRMSTADEGDKP